jgi:hypothetical protein
MTVSPKQFVYLAVGRKQINFEKEILVDSLSPTTQ